MKEEISKGYMEQQKAIHAAKPLARCRSALVVGSDRKSNIGAVISQRLRIAGASVSEPDINAIDVTTVRDLEGAEQDILILANGVTRLDWFEDNSREDILSMFEVNVIGSLAVANLFVKDTINLPFKKYIVFIGSMAYRHVLNGSAIYCASKAALAHASKCLAWELAPKGYNVFCVHPSNVLDTPMTEETIKGLMRYRNLSRGEAERYWGASCPKASFLTSQEIAATVSHLVSGTADYMSGSNVELAGGQR